MPMDILGNLDMDMFDDDDLHLTKMDPMLSSPNFPTSNSASYPSSASSSSRCSSVETIDSLDSVL